MDELDEDVPTEGKRGRNESFNFRVTATFMLIAIMTAVLMGSVSLLLWNMAREFFISENSIALALVIAGVVSIVLASMVGVYFASDVVKPVRKVATTAKAIKNGDLSARTGLEGPDELSQLGMDFDAMAESIERDRDLERQLIGDVAHELRTPLMAMQATIEAIQDGVLPADEVRLSTLSAETRRLGRLVEALLHLNRLENGTIVAKRETLNLSEILADLALSQQMLIESMGLEFSVQIDPEITVKGDRDLINQAVSNLISNAVRYTPEGGKISLACIRYKRNAEVYVTDTGIGISEEDQKKVFTRFWRADQARSYSGNGLGIGLALVKEVTDQHHGSLSLESTLGEGSTFIMRIPLAPSDPTLKSTMDKNAKSMQRKLERAQKKERDRQRREQARKERQPLQWPLQRKK